MLWGEKKLTFVETWMSCCKALLELGVAHAGITHASRLQLCSAHRSAGGVYERLNTETARVVTCPDCQALLISGVLQQLIKNGR